MGQHISFEIVVLPTEVVVVVKHEEIERKKSSVNAPLIDGYYTCIYYEAC